MPCRVRRYKRVRPKLEKEEEETHRNRIKKGTQGSGGGRGTPNNWYGAFTPKSCVILLS
jgi:hypothetical protein